VDLLLRENQVRRLEEAPKEHHEGLFTWMYNRRPLSNDSDKFILHVGDFVSVAKQSERGTRITELLEILVRKWPTPFGKVLLLQYTLPVTGR
jgi:hypothetical protein